MDNNNNDDIEVFDLEFDDDDVVADSTVDSAAPFPSEEPVAPKRYSMDAPITTFDLDDEDSTPTNSVEGSLEDIPEKPVSAKKKISKAERRRRKRRKKMIRLAVFCTALLIFIISGALLINALVGYHKAKKIYADVSDSIFGENVDVELKNNVSTGSGKTPAPGDETETTTVSLYTSYDHNALLKLNKDGVGYLQIPAINILLPVVQGSDNDYYLNHTITGVQNSSGTLFIDYRLPAGIESQNCIVYGHDMRNGSMFGSLNRFTNRDFLQKNNNRYFYFYIGDKIYKYEIYSVHTTPAVGYIYTPSFETPLDFLAYVKKSMSESYYAAGITFNGDEKTMTFSTCTNDDNTRLVVQGVRVAELDIAIVAAEQAANQN